MNSQSGVNLKVKIIPEDSNGKEVLASFYVKDIVADNVVEEHGGLVTKSWDNVINSIRSVIGLNTYDARKSWRISKDFYVNTDGLYYIFNKLKEPFDSGYEDEE